MPSTLRTAAGAALTALALASCTATSTAPSTSRHPSSPTAADSTPSSSSGPAWKAAARPDSFYAALRGDDRGVVVAYLTAKGEWCVDDHTLIRDVLADPGDVHSVTDVPALWASISRGRPADWTVTGAGCEGSNPDGSANHAYFGADDTTVVHAGTSSYTLKLTPTADGVLVRNLTDGSARAYVRFPRPH